MGVQLYICITDDIPYNKEGKGIYILSQRNCNSKLYLLFSH